MKKIKTSLKNAGEIFVSAFLFASAVVFAGCAFSEQNVSSADISDISAKMSFENVSRQAYMGGSVLYNPDDLSNSQLAENVCVAVRLGKVKRNEIDEDQVVFTDDEDSAKFGFMKINSISTSSVAFSYTEFSADGKSLTTASFNVAEGDSVDINSDGFYDLKYAKPKIKRVGLENARWLTFLSSQDDLNTSMFSVLPEQYSRNVYPAGLLGINPDGKFIVNKYEVGSSKRAAVQGLVKGDFVLDSESGEYQRFVGNSSYKSARSIDDAELETSTDFLDTDFYFSEDDFSNGYSALDLIRNLPVQISQKYDAPASENEAISVLNEILKDKELISVSAQSKSIVLDDEILDILNIIESLNERELVSLNRMFLSDTYDECPNVDFNCVDITEVLPLLSLSIDEQEIESHNDEVRAATYSEYEAKRRNIENICKGYKSISVLNLHADNMYDIIGKMYFGGTYSISWSNMEASIAYLMYMKAETSRSLGKKDYSIEKSLIGGPKKLFSAKKNFPIGPIVVSSSLDGQFDLRYGISGSAELVSNINAGFVSLFGTRARIGANYGTKWVKWFKVWRKWVYRPKAYFDFYADSGLVKEVAYYVELPSITTDSSLPADVNLSGKAVLTPVFTVTPKVGVYNNTLWLGADCDNMLDVGVEATSRNLKSYKIDGIVDYRLKISPKVGYDLTIPVINKRLSAKDRALSTINLPTRRLATWTIVDKR